MNFKEYWSDKSNNYDYPMPAAKDAWEHQQAQVAELKAQLNNMEQCYIGMKKERDELLDCEKDKRIEKCLGLIESLYIEDFNQRSNANIHISQFKDLEKALRGEQ